MSLTASVLVDGTVATTGGTATSFKSQGSDKSSHELVLDDSAEFEALTFLDCSIKKPKVSATAPNGYTQRRCTMLLKVPLALDNGSVTINTVKIEIATDVEMTAAEKLSMRVLAAQLIHDSEFVDFWDTQLLD
jgi:hypothetical protein